ncbi:hypothetical protein MN0502_20830 [Arthrobacter sp. MN05-02]|nr:hypothetical protein MN0502_20830 [Arthrobacter sp. MN05-02]
MAGYSHGGRPAIVLWVTKALTTDPPADTGPTPAAVNAANSALFTDQYELTMLQASLHSGAAHRRSVFEAFARRLPAGRRYGVVAGTGRLLEELATFRFDDAQLAFLSDHRIVDDTTLAWLAGFRFSGSISGYAEGEAYFPNSPHPDRGVDVRRGVHPRDAHPLDPQPRQRHRVGGVPHDRCGRRPALHRDGLAPHARGGSRGLRAFRDHRRFRQHVQPRGGAPLRPPHRRHGGALLHPAARLRA